MSKLSLINSEGDILSVKLDRKTNLYEVIDEDKITLTHWDKEELIDFIIGNSSIIDSTNRIWNYSKLDTGMKAMPDKIVKFLKETL